MTRTERAVSTQDSTLGRTPTPVETIKSLTLGVLEPLAGPIVLQHYADAKTEVVEAIIGRALRDRHD